MKNSALKFIAFIFVLAISSCSISSDKQSIYERIATDETYEILRESLSKSTLLITTDQIDLDAIGQHLNENPETAICDINNEILGQIKGGLEYKRLSCKMKEARRVLKEKYPEYSDFTKADTYELRNVYRKKVASPSELNALTIIENINH